MAMPIATAAAIGRAASGSARPTSRIRLDAVCFDVAFSECARALGSRIVSSLSEAVGR
jgi:hypothetical protein